MSCCGKTVCSGCAYAPVYDNQGNEVDEKTCPFCRIPQPKSTEEADTREKKRMEKDDPIAIYNTGNYYRDGSYGLPQDYTKAFELWSKAGELGNAAAHNCIGFAYDHGRGVEVDKKKAKHYFELAAMMGDEKARYNLGTIEENVGNKIRALKHYIIAARGGNSESLEAVKDLYSLDLATKEDYTKALCTYQEYLGEVKSLQRDKVAATGERHRYYY